MKNVCSTCHYENLIENRFCTQCGGRLQPVETATPRLTILNENEKKDVIILNNTHNTIGRDIENTVVIDDERISRRHASIYYHQGHYWLKDFDSKNGIYLNGKKISNPERLSDGYLIRMGSTIFRFEISQHYRA